SSVTKILHNKEKWLDASSTTHHNTLCCRQVRFPELEISNEHMDWTNSFPTKSSMEIPVFSVPETKKEEIEPEKEILKKIESVPSTSKNSEIIDIPEPILKKYNLSTESNPSQLCVYASELGAMLPDWKARKNVKEALRRRQFKEEQIKALI
ncbi:12860_t:CDS:2, partial [Entrophospora sp. SA101]